MTVLVRLTVFTLGVLAFAEAYDLPACQPGQFHYEYTECDSDGGRWRVSVPNTGNNCSVLQNPVRGQKCEFTCESGQYLDIQGEQVCQPCPPGTYSLGGGVRFDDWDHLPSGFAVKTESFSVDKFYPHGMEEAKNPHQNCSKAGWIPKGNSIASLAAGCSASLIYSTTLVRPGQVRFTYQYTDDESIFHFSVQNNECQTVSDKGSNRWPSTTAEGEWKTISVHLKSGLNLLKWRTLGVDSNENNFKKPILIRNIEISGVAYTSECTKCRNGTYSAEGATSCEPCLPNTWSGRGAYQCIPCTSDKYSSRGAAKCLVRPPCSDKDYFDYNSPCNENKQTQVMYKWIEPRVCLEKVPGAVSLPPSGRIEPCPPCNPGMEAHNGTCRFCPPNQHSDGMSQCKPCSVSTAPVRGLMYKWWHSLPPEANISTTCLSLTGGGCSSKKGWVPALDHIHSGKGHADDVYLILSLKVGGFAGQNVPIRGKATAVGYISFVFELDCTKDCLFFFMMQSESGATTVIEKWEGRKGKQQYSYTLTKTDRVTFTWAFQKGEWPEDDESREDAVNSVPRFELVNDMAKIYSINVTNTLDGGASSCQLCPKGSNNQGCIPCPVGHYVDSNTTKCHQCPTNTVIHGSGTPWGEEACQSCGQGLVATSNRAKCVSDGHFHSPQGIHYDLSSFKSVIGTTGSPLFTASGTQYFHFFNISLLGNNDKFPLATCRDNITYYEGDTIQDVVTAAICRVTLVPPHPGDIPTVMATQPVSLGDELVNITSNKSDPYISRRMDSSGFSMEDSIDVHFTYVSKVPTSVCRSGRTTLITLRCDVNRKGQGEMELPPNCPDGTCDGCNFHFLWLSRAACPICKKDDYQMLVGECVKGEQTVHFITPKHCVLQSDSKPKMKTQPCSILPFWLEVVISACVGVGIILIILLIYCWKRNRKLEYKYSKLVEGRDGKEGELPGADSCGLDEEEDDEHYDAVAFKESKGKALFKKIKFMAKKDADNPFESIQLTMKDNLMT